MELIQDLGLFLINTKSGLHFVMILYIWCWQISKLLNELIVK